MGYGPSLNAPVVGGAVACCTWENGALVGNAWGCPIRFNSRRNKIRVSAAPGKPERSWCNQTGDPVVAIRYRTAASPKECTGQPSTACGITRNRRRLNFGTARRRECWNSKQECSASWTRYAPGSKPGGVDRHIAQSYQRGAFHKHLLI